MWWGGAWNFVMFISTPESCWMIQILRKPANENLQVISHDETASHASHVLLFWKLAGSFAPSPPPFPWYFIYLGTYNPGILLLSLLIPLCWLWITIHVKTLADFPSVIGGHVAACNFPLWRMGVSEKEMPTGFSQCSPSFSNFFPWYLVSMG